MADSLTNTPDLMPVTMKLSIILPTYNERENFLVVVARLREILREEAFEIIIAVLFLIRRELIHRIAPALYRQGFKILLDILLRGPELTVKELRLELN